MRAIMGYRNGSADYDALSELFPVGSVMDIPGTGGTWKRALIEKHLDPKHGHWPITVVVKIKTLDAMPSVNSKTQ